MPDFKIAILERDGVDLGYQEELAHIASNMAVDNSSNFIDSDNAQDAILEMGSKSVFPYCEFALGFLPVDETCPRVLNGGNLSELSTGEVRADGGQL